MLRPLLAAAFSLLIASPAALAADGRQMEENKKIVAAFYDAAVNQKDFEKASQYLGARYTQHNPLAADGREGFKGFITFLKDKFPNNRSEIKRIFADGDYVIVHVHALREPGSRPASRSRLMAEQIGRGQGGTVVVEDRPGGGTVIGTEAGGRAERDGRTVLLVANSFVIKPPLQRASYNPSTSFEPVCYLAATPMVLVVLGSSPYRTLNDLIAAARAKPGELAFASGGPGSSLHIAIEVLKRAANLNITYVPYGGTAPAINPLMGNHVAAVCADHPTVGSQLQSGALRRLVTTSHARIETLPCVPTLGETGVSQYEAEVVYRIVAPPET